MLWPTGNVPIVDMSSSLTHRRRLALRARKRASSWITHVIHRTVQTRAKIRGSDSGPFADYPVLQSYAFVICERRSE
jgi:hypothetical protein